MTTQAYLYRTGDLLQVATVADSNDFAESYALHMNGTATTLPADEENESVRRLREVVREVTGRDVPQPSKQRIGFLP